MREIPIYKLDDLGGSTILGSPHIDVDIFGLFGPATVDQFGSNDLHIKASLGDSGQHEDHAELHGKSHHSGAFAFKACEAFFSPA
jgi:hypothetical protein